MRAVEGGVQLKHDGSGVERAEVVEQRMRSLEHGGSGGGGGSAVEIAVEAVETAAMEEAPVEAAVKAALEKFEQLVTPLITLATAKVKQASHAGLNTSSDALDVQQTHTLPRNVPPAVRRMEACRYTSP